MTSATKLTKQTAGSTQKSHKTRGDDDLDEAANLHDDGSAPRGDPDFDPDPAATQAQQLEDEVAMEEERIRLEEEKKNKRGDTDFPELFKDEEGQ